MKKSYCFYIVSPEGEMRCTQKNWCTLERALELFGHFKNEVREEYPESSVAWTGEDWEAELRKAKEEIENLKEELEYEKGTG